MKQTTCMSKKAYTKSIKKELENISSLLFKFSDETLKTGYE